MRLFIELLVLGTGLAIFAILGIFLGFGASVELVSEPDYYLFFFNEGMPLTILFSPGILCVLGIISDQISHALFWPWENSFRKSVSPVTSDESASGARRSSTYYFQLRNYIYSHTNYSALAYTLTENRSKIRIARGWTLNALLITIQLIIYEVNSLEFDPFLFPLICIMTIICLGCIWAWQNYMHQELRLYETFNENLLS